MSEFTQSVGGTNPFLTRDDCVIVNKRKTEHSVALTLKRESDGEEGLSHVKVKAAFQGKSEKLLNSVFADKNIIGLTLNQLAEYKVDPSLEELK